MNASKDFFDEIELIFNKYKIERLEYDDNYTYKDIFNLIMKSLGCEKTVLKKFKDKDGIDIDPKFCKTADRCNGKYFWKYEDIREKVDFMISQALGQNSQQVPKESNSQKRKRKNSQSEILPHEQATFAKNLFIVIDFLSGADFEFKYIFLLIDYYLDHKSDCLVMDEDSPLSESSEADLHYKYLLELAYNYFHDVLQILSKEGNKSYSTLLKDQFEEKLKCEPYYTNIYLFLIKNNSSDVDISSFLFRDNKNNSFTVNDVDISNKINVFLDDVCIYISNECKNLSYSKLIISVQSYLKKNYPDFFSYNLNPEINDDQFVEALVDSLFENQYLGIRYKWTSKKDFTNEETGWFVHWQQYEKKVKKELFCILFRREQLEAVKNNSDINYERLKEYAVTINDLNGLSIQEFYTLILQGLKSEGFKLD